MRIELPPLDGEGGPASLVVVRLEDLTYAGKPPFFCMLHVQEDLLLPLSRLLSGLSLYLCARRWAFFQSPSCLACFLPCILVLLAARLILTGIW